ncbi:ethyl tert-butyl ether degradation [Phlyctema vagabunda]|uniref:Ethyl tert-butyl ether degradation n=1 Tax=Phlyctema vagabunda TaxID=108571 RepID=A0ABR4PB74_9HELO
MTVTILLFFTHTSELDFDYYTNTHMKRASELIGSDILISWEVFKLPDDAPYRAMVTTEWPSEEAFKIALDSKEGRLAHDDLPNCSKEEPIFALREFVGSSATVLEGKK